MKEGSRLCDGGIPEGGYSTPSYPGCVGSNWREMGPFWTWREGNGVLLYGCILEGSHLYGCVYRELTPIWVCFRGLSPV